MAFYDVFNAFILRCLFSDCQIEYVLTTLLFLKKSVTKLNAPQEWKSNFWTGHGDFFPKKSVDSFPFGNGVVS